MTIEELHTEAHNYCLAYFEGDSKHPSYDACFTAFINGAKSQDKLFNNGD